MCWITLWRASPPEFQKQYTDYFYQCVGRRVLQGVNLDPASDQARAQWEELFNEQVQLRTDILNVFKRVSILSTLSRFHSIA